MTRQVNGFDQNVHSETTTKKMVVPGLVRCFKFITTCMVSDGL